ncbi:MAG: ATP-grasp domain-containing protein [Planctomycetaceae bacterium]|nr:ATP-grasp domain-containing protein [Planctomycetaceae bacterium]
MRVFISELTCGGGWPEPEISGSLAREGRAMLCAIVADFARVDGVRVTTTWDARLGTQPFDCAHTIVVDSPDDEPAVFRELAQVCDATLVIAPETDNLLVDRCRLVEGTWGRLLGPGSLAVEIGTDKQRLASRLQKNGVATIPTCNFQSSRLIGLDRDKAALMKRMRRMNFPPALQFPLVIKPCDGAGSQSIYLVRDHDQLLQLDAAIDADPLLESAIWQPFVAGRAVSVGVMYSYEGEIIEVFPPAEQVLSDDGRFRYLGGVIPARGVDLTSIQHAARAACEAVPGLRGFVGVDLIVPDANPDQPVVVEINPRLTTSYIGYRRLTDENLAERMLPGGNSRPIVWREGCVSFDAAGDVRSS